MWTVSVSAETVHSLKTLGNDDFNPKKAAFRVNSTS